MHLHGEQRLIMFPVCVATTHTKVQIQVKIVATENTHGPQIIILQTKIYFHGQQRVITNLVEEKTSIILHWKIRTIKI